VQRSVYEHVVSGFPLAREWRDRQTSHRHPREGGGPGLGAGPQPAPATPA